MEKDNNLYNLLNLKFVKLSFYIPLHCGVNIANLVTVLRQKRVKMGWQKLLYQPKLGGPFYLWGVWSTLLWDIVLQKGYVFTPGEHFLVEQAGTFCEGRVNTGCKTDFCRRPGYLHFPARCWVSQPFWLRLFAGRPTPTAEICHTHSKE